MSCHVNIEEIAGLLKGSQLRHLQRLARHIDRKLSLREMAIVLRGIERGVNANEIVSTLRAGGPAIERSVANL